MKNMSNEIFQKLDSELENKVQRDISLKDYTTYQIGGPAKYLIEADSHDLLLKSYKLANKLNINFIILGGGSNILVSSQGFAGLVIINKYDELKIKDEIVEVGSGYNLTKLCQETAKAGLSGLEFVAGIYGTVGGAVAGNAGAYGSDMSGIVEDVEIMDKEGNIKKLKNEDLKFSYRSSIFREGFEGLILKIWLKLVKGDPKKILEIIKNRLKERTDLKQTKFPSAGCVFRNILFSEVDLDKLKNKGVDVEKFEEIKKIPVGYLIESLDLKGKKMGGAMVSKEHGNFIYNVGNAKAEDVVMLISYIKQQIRDNYGVQLQEEIKYIGF
jgi:UDP-N-acetylmuramate dehydrogenase